MKKLLMTSVAALCLMSAVTATAQDSVRFTYVVQNPKFFGLNEASSWFEISGLGDKNIERKINAYLRSVFFEKTLLDTQGGGTLQPRDTPKGYTDYTFFNGETYGSGWIRFKDQDSLLRLSDADGYYGAGTNLGGFSQEVAQGKLAWIGISTSYHLETTLTSGRTIDITFDLRTGAVIASQYIVRIDPAKKDSLDKTLLTLVNRDLTNGGMFRDAKITGSDRIADSVVVTTAQLIRWMHGVRENYPFVITRYYDVDATLVHNNQKSHWRPQASLSLDESIPFFVQEDWSKLLTL